MFPSRLLMLASLVLLTTGCALYPTSVGTSAVAADTAVACASDLKGRALPGTGSLSASGLDIVNWNIQKGRDLGWKAELLAMDESPDLVLLQEALPHRIDRQILLPDHHEAFARGFGPDSAPSGVMTLSRAAAISTCELVTHEPWLGTRKATLVTEYGLGESSLLVVNIHAVNFTFGTDDLERQVGDAAEVIAAHEGPVIFSGDFNTWRGQRAAVVENALADLGLTAIAFENDHRKRVFGNALDHIYVRGLHGEDSATAESSVSDHNPMAARLSLIGAVPFMTGSGQ